MNNDEPARKRSKLVLPSPQISDIEMEQIVKLGRHSEAARLAGGSELNTYKSWGSSINPLNVQSYGLYLSRGPGGGVSYINSGVRILIPN